MRPDTCTKLAAVLVVLSACGAPEAHGTADSGASGAGSDATSSASSSSGAGSGGVNSSSGATSSGGASGSGSTSSGSSGAKGPDAGSGGSSGSSGSGGSSSGSMSSGSIGVGGSGSSSGGLSSSDASTSGSGPSSDGAAGDSGATCPLGTTFQWSSSGPLISAISDATHPLNAVKDPSVVFFNNRWHVYASDVDTSGNYNMLYLNFTDWSQAAAAPQTYLDVNPPGISGYHAAPQVFFFAPQNKWYLIYQSGPPQYSTAADLSQPSGWTKPQSFFTGTPAIVTQSATNTNGVVWIDFWVICDDTTCYLFFENDDGFLFRSQTPIGSFPSGFDTPVVVMQDTNINNIFEASNVYKLKGQNKYLLLIEAIGTHRYFRSWTADTLGGAWTLLNGTYAAPFAGLSNVTFTGTAWTQNISHGEMLRDGYDQTLTIDPCNLQYLYQGVNPANANVSYNLIPWQLGLLTQTK